MTDNLKKLTGMDLAQWREFAKRDDCLDKIVPSDLRVLISYLTNPDMFWDWEDPEMSTSDPYEMYTDALGYGPDVLRVQCARSLPDMWIATVVQTIDGDGEPDEMDTTAFDTEAEAEACYDQSLAELRKKEGWEDG